jgi:hypothetical protein
LRRPNKLTSESDATMPIDNVEVWCVIDGIGHVVAEETGKSYLKLRLLCDQVGNRGERVTHKPKRVCRACRARFALLERSLSLPK